MNRRRRAQRGQVVIVFALLITVVLGFAGLALDGAEIDFTQRSLQGTADAVAMAAAWDLSASGGNDSSATNLAAITTQVETDNGCTATTNCTAAIVYENASQAAVTPGPGVTVSYIAVTITELHSNIFIQIIGSGATTSIKGYAVSQTASPMGLIG